MFSCGRSRFVAAALTALALVLFGQIPASAQLQLAPLTVVVLDSGGEPVSAIVVALTDPFGAELQRALTDPFGRAQFNAIASGRYEVRTTPAGTSTIQLPLTVAGALPIEMTVRVPAAVRDRVTVEGATADEPSSRASIAGESLAHVPVRVRNRAIQEVVATLAGWSTEDNGLLHTRGVDDGFLYVIDGVPVYERLDALSGFAPDRSAVAAVNVITGYVPPEFGYKAGGVIEVRSASAHGAWQGTAELTVGSDDARDGSFSAGGRVGSRANIRAGIVSARSNRFLDPVHPDSLHNHGGQSNTFGQLDWSAARDRVTAGWGYGRARFDVPNNEEQEESGQDQRQRNAQGYLNVTWQRAWAPSTVTQVAAYHRRTNVRLDGSPFDTPVEAHADRQLLRTGALVGATRQQGAHLVKFGLEYQRLSIDETFGFAITDEDEAEEAEFRDEVLVFTPDNPFRFTGEARPSLISLYLQDSWHIAPALTVSGGVRFDRSELLLTRQQWSPRVGAAFRLGPDTVLRAALSRFFQPPQPENLLLSSSPEARVLSSISVGDAEGGADLEPERQWGTELGLNHRLGAHLRLDVAYWHRRIEDAADPNVFAGTTIIFPNAVAKGRAHGLEMRLELPKSRGWSGYANWATARVVQTGPITGGLFLEDEVEELGPGVEFSPDHDQRFAAGGGLTWEHGRSGLTVSMTGRYETGTPVQRDDEDELRELPGAEMVDFESGRVKPRTIVSVQALVPVVRNDRVTVRTGLEILNLLDARYAFNFGNPFSGTHFGAPRSFAATVRVAFN